MRIEGDEVIFTSGKTCDANHGIIGLSPDMDVTEGWDGCIYKPEDEYFDKLSKADLIELADYMIAEWTKFKAIQEAKP